MPLLKINGKRLVSNFSLSDDYFHFSNRSVLKYEIKKCLYRLDLQSNRRECLNTFL